MARRENYRKLAFEHYPPICVYCGFGIPEVLEVAHIDGTRGNNTIENLVILCPTCHKMHDIDLIPTDVVRELRDRERAVDWSKRMKDAGQKAAATRRLRAEVQKQAGRKAAATRKRRAAARRASETRRQRSDERSA